MTAIDHTRRRSWILLHVVFWIVNFLLILHPYMQHSRLPAWKLLPQVLIIFSFQIVCVYTIVWLLVPVVRRQQYLLFILGVLAIIITVSGLETLAMSFYSISIRGTALTMFTVAWFGMVYEMVPVCIMFIGPVLFYEYYKQNERNKLLEQEQLKTELLFLKGQINPHFMFNALNSIYVLMRLKKDMAEETIMRFSTLLRYSLYECSEPLVLLEKEINFLDDYINLEKLRYSGLEIIYEKPEKFYSKRIAPFLLMPFLENAFKHVSHNETQRNFIHVKVWLDENNLHFNCSNSYNKEENDHKTGIGLENIRRRLLLLYPKRHTLEITDANNIFNIKLIINGIENDLHHSG